MSLDARHVLINWGGAAVVALVVALLTSALTRSDNDSRLYPAGAQVNSLGVGAPGGWINVKAYGARGDGSSDDSRAIQAAINAARRTPAGDSGSGRVRGAVIYFPRGHYLASRPLNADNSVSLALQGDGTQTQGHGTLPGSDITYTGGGSGGFLLARSSSGFALRNLGVDYQSSAFTGVLLDFSHAPGRGTDAAYMTLDNCLLTGTNVWSAHALVSFHLAILGSVQNCHLSFAQAGIVGKAFAGNSSGYANAIEIQGCTFDNLRSAALMNAGEGWTIVGNRFEGTDGGTGGMPRAYSDDLPGGPLTSQTAGLSFIGNWFGDAVAVKSAWVTLGPNTIVRGLDIAGNFFSGGRAAVAIPGNASGISISGNFMGTATSPVDLGKTIKDGVSIAGNALSPNVPPVANLQGHKHLAITANSSG